MRELRVAALQRQPAAARAATRPATSRSSDDLPAPFGPVTSERLAGADREAQARKHLPAAPDAGKVGARSRIRRPGHRSAGGTARDRPGPLRRPQAHRKLRHLRCILLRRIDFLEPRKKRPYKPDRPALDYRTPRGCRDRRRGALPVVQYRSSRCLSTRLDGNRHLMTSLDSFRAASPSRSAARPTPFTASPPPRRTA